MSVIYFHQVTDHFPQTKSTTSPGCLVPSPASSRSSSHISTTSRIADIESTTTGIENGDWPRSNKSVLFFFCVGVSIDFVFMENANKNGGLVDFNPEFDAM